MKQNTVAKPKAIYYEQASNRLLFRKMTLEDHSAWLEFFAEEDDYHRFLGQDLTIAKKTRAKIWIERQIQRMDEKHYGQLAILEQSSGNLIGLGGIIMREMNGTIEYEVTYSLIPRYWGKGYATELAQHFSGYAREHLEIDSVISMIHPENIASIKVAQRNNMTLDGEFFIFGMNLAVYRQVF
ncbi:MAG: ribosomal-protein-alanine N-acetyltransferase [Flavobacteriaceae bacterium]|jgi:ribosomal-protein-alanine N-acetyltransferase